MLGADIAYGFKGHRVMLRDGNVVDGLEKSSTEKPINFVNNEGSKTYLVIVTMGSEGGGVWEGTIDPTAYAGSPKKRRRLSSSMTWNSRCP